MERRGRFGFVVMTGRYKILDYDKSDGQQIATADNEDAARLIRGRLNDYDALIEQRDRLAAALQRVQATWNDFSGRSDDFFRYVAGMAEVMEDVNAALATVEQGGGEAGRRDFIYLLTISY